MSKRRTFRRAPGKVYVSSVSRVIPGTPTDRSLGSSSVGVSKVPHELSLTRPKSSGGKVPLRKDRDGYTVIDYGKLVADSHRDVSRMDEGYQISRLKHSYDRIERRLVKAAIDGKDVGKLAALLSETRAKIMYLLDQIERHAL